MLEYEKHILKADVGANQSWCGVDIYSNDWVFVNIDHAVLSMLNGSRLIPCSKCVNFIIEVLREEK